LALKGSMPREAAPRQPVAPDIDGFLNAAVRGDASDRKLLEQLFRYITRPSSADSQRH